MSTKNLARIAALLRLSDSAGDTPEGRSARAMAERMARRHGVTLDAARAHGPANGLGAVDLFDYEPKSSAMWLAMLGWAVARFTNVRMVRLPPKRGKRKSKLTIIGTAADFELWRSMFERAALEIEAESNRYAARLVGMRSARSEADTFRKGAAEGFRERLERARREREASQLGAMPARDESTALVMVSRAAAVERKVDEAFPRLRAAPVKMGGGRDSRAAGERFGRSMGVHRGNLA